MKEHETDIVKKMSIFYRNAIFDFVWHKEATMRLYSFSFRVYVALDIIIKNSFLLTGMEVSPMCAMGNFWMILSRVYYLKKLYGNITLVIEILKSSSELFQIFLKI